MKIHFQEDSGTLMQLIRRGEEEMLINAKDSRSLKSTDNKNH